MDKDLPRILENSEIVAVIGCSAKKMRTSHQIAGYLKDNGYTIIPVHPDYKEVLGEKAYANINDIPQETEIDIVDIFRNSDHTAAMVDDIIKRVNRTGRKPVIWTQLGVSSDEARKKAEEAGLQYVEEKCMMVEHQRLTG